MTNSTTTATIPPRPRSKTLKEFSDSHRLDAATARGLILSGALIAKKVGRLTIITEDDERAWLASLPSVLDDDPPKKPRAKAAAPSAKQEG